MNRFIKHHPAPTARTLRTTGNSQRGGALCRRAGRGVFGVLSRWVFFVTAVFLLLAVGSTPAAAAKTTITNFAKFSGTTKLFDETTVDVLKIERTPATIELLRFATSGTPYSVSLPEFGAGANTAGPFTPLALPAAPYAGGPPFDLSQPVPLVPATYFHNADVVFILLTDLDQNLYDVRQESIVVTLTTSNGDSEVLRLYETTPDSGVFSGFITPRNSELTPVTVGDGILSVSLEATFVASYTDVADQTDTSAISSLFDPLGTVFDSTTGEPVDGATVTIIDMTTGQPASAFGDDGLSSYPASVVSGGSVTDSSGRVYTFPPGGYRFPLLASGNYRLDVAPPIGWTAPSTASTADLQNLPGSPWIILEPGSRGEPFMLAPVPILRLDVPVDPAPAALWVQKTANKTVAGIGDFVLYTITLSNTSQRGIARAIQVHDVLPQGLRYQPGSARIAALPVADPVIAANGRTLRFDLAQLTAQQSVTISYVVEVAASARPGAAVNQASASAAGGVRSNTASATITIKEELLRSRSLVVGRVMSGPCDQPDTELEGVAGVRIYLEDGTFVVTDKDGLYHLEGLRPGSHVLQLDEETLPEGYTGRSCVDTTRFAGNNVSQFVDVQGGTLWRADFHIGPTAQLQAQQAAAEQAALKAAARAARPLAELTLTSTVAGDVATLRSRWVGGPRAFKDARLEITLPAAAVYLPGTARINGSLTPDPAAVSGTLVFPLGAFAADSAGELTMAVEVDLNAAAADLAAGAQLIFTTDANEELASPLAEKTFRRDLTTAIETRKATFYPRFASFSTTLTDADRAALDLWLTDVAAQPIDALYIIGHTDNVPIAPRSHHLFADNLALSLTRAESLAAYLRETMDTLPATIVTVRRGDAVPVGDNRTSEGRAANRRVDILAQVQHEVTRPVLNGVKTDSGQQQMITAGEAALKFPVATGVGAVQVKTAQNAAGSEATAGLLSPTDGAMLPNPINAVRVRLDSRLKPVLAIDGKEISAERIGFTMADKASKKTLYSYIGVDFGGPGEHLLEIKGIGPFGNARFTDSATVNRTGAVTTIRVVESATNIADGVTPVRVRLEVRDNADKLISSGLSLEIVSGNLKPLPVDGLLGQAAVNDAKTVSIDSDGWVQFEPVNQSGVYTAQLAYGDISTTLETYVNPKLRDWILVGLGEGTAGYTSVSSNMENFAASDQPEDFFTDGRIAFFAKGKVLGSWLLTAAYDSDKPKDNRLEQTIDPDSYYTVYGDGSQQQYDAASQHKLYVKLERAQFYALFGDYSTGLTVTELSRYSRSLNGFKSELQNRYLTWNIFAADTSQNFVKDEIPGDGTSGLYRLSRRDIVINSEKIVIETRDRFDNNQIVESRSLSRHLDYNIDYDDGSLFFKEPVPTRDSDFNPVFIVVDYESDARGDQALNYGGRAALRLFEQRIEVGATAVHEGQTGVEGDLYGSDATLKLTPKTTVRAEAARTETTSTPRAEAWLAEVTHKGSVMRSRAYINEQQAGFGLGQQRDVSGGIRKLGVEADVTLGEKLTADSTLSREINLQTDAERDLAEVAVSWKEKLYSLRLGLRQATERKNDGSPDATSLQGVFSSDWTLWQRLTLRFNHDQALGGSNAASSHPTRTLVGADYRLTEAVSVYANQEWARGDNQESESTSAGLKATPWQGAQAMTGVEQTITEAGTRTAANMGLKQTWQVTAQISVDAGLDRSQTLRAPGPDPMNPNAVPTSGDSDDYTAMSTGFNWKEAKWSWENRLEYRTADSEDKWNLLSSALGELRQGVAVSGRTQLTLTDASASETTNGDIRLGIAWRPVESHWVFLDRLDFLFDRQTGVGNFSNWRLINSLHANVKPNRRTQVALQYGLKYVQENIAGQSYSGFTDLLGFEGRYDLTPSWDIGVHGNLVHSWHSDQYDYRSGVSVGYKVMKNAWLSIGYNLTGFYDEDFSRADFTAQGAFLKFRFKFDQHSVKDAINWLGRQ
ncbi:MAG: OmpA family protein [Desulfuromonadales bacterium]|nr:OmpA family protein [Desulfuromonadales bacterium]